MLWYSSTNDAESGHGDANVGGKYENDYAIKYTLNENGKIIEQKEYLSDLLLAQRLYGQDLCGDKRTME